MFENLQPRPPDPILSLIGMYNSDARAGKIDLGVGVYRDEQGRTPVLGAVKAAEQLLVGRQSTKAYLGAEGNLEFLELLRPIVLGNLQLGERLVGLQTPGGSGALRLAAELAAQAVDSCRVWVGDPTWPIHRSFFAAAGLEVVPYPYFDAASQQLQFSRLCEVIAVARAGDVVLLHGCCHNPSGADLSRAQWQEIAELLADKAVVPLLDLAYQGLGDGLEEDAYGVRLVLGSVPEALLAYSCDKNFGLYRERTGAIFAVVANAAQASVIRSNLCDLARGNWSMPPDHGAAVVTAILGSAELRQQWQAELSGMRQRLLGIRELLASQIDTGPATFAAIGGQRGLFSLLSLDRPVIDRLRRAHGIYMAGSGRINIAGLSTASVPRFVSAVAATLNG